MRAALKGKFIAVLLLLIAAGAAAAPEPGDLSELLPRGNEVTGWTLGEEPKSYRGDQLYLMINGGADIYHEYGFIQALGAEYVNGGGKSIKLEIYEMQSPASAYGIHTFKIGDGGETMAIGQEALLEDYYLNFWKGNFQVSVIGADAEKKTVQGVIEIARALDARIAATGERPELADLLLREPDAFSRPRYIRGSLGLMNSYLFDTENIFRIREAMAGAMGDCRALVFRYPDESESAGAYEQAVAKLAASPRFKDGKRQENRYSMIGRGQEMVAIEQTGRFISVVIGQDPDTVRAASAALVAKLHGA